MAKIQSAEQLKRAKSVITSYIFSIRKDNRALVKRIQSIDDN
jgi:hypothetical protein